MGGTAWSDSDYSDRMSYRAKSAASTGRSVDSVVFDYHSKVSSGAAKGPHASLDPKGVVFRESRDSDVHPNAVPVAVLLDVTGSMSSVPRVVQQNLPKLMGLLMRRNYLEHPAIMIGAVGDATCDRVPFQIGQFESGIEIEDNLTNLYLESGGGGQQTESYELAMYFMAKHTVHDHFEKRGEKGYCFIIGDEMPYQQVSPSQVEAVLGQKIQAPVPIAEVVEALKEKYNLFYIMPKQTSNFGNKAICAEWKKWVGQNLILLDDPAGICECIAAQIGVFEGVIDSPDRAVDDLISENTSKKIAKSVSRAIVVAGAGDKKKGSIQKVPDSGKSSGLATF